MRGGGGSAGREGGEALRHVSVSPAESPALGSAAGSRLPPVTAAVVAARRAGTPGPRGAAAHAARGPGPRAPARRVIISLAAALCALLSLERGGFSLRTRSAPAGKTTPSSAGPWARSAGEGGTGGG